MNISFENKRIMVTGAGRGIGRAIVEKLISCNAHVIAVSKTKENLDSLKKSFGNSVDIVQLDLSNWDETRTKLSNIGIVHGLVNNAGVAELDSFLEAKEDSFDRVFSVNVKAILNVSQIVVKSMIDNNVNGSIVNISSQASKAALPDHSIYCASKAALDSLSRVMALELPAYKIRVNCINPTVVLTDMAKVFWNEEINARKMLHKIPMGRFCEVSDVIGSVLFLLSDYSAMINGVSLPVDGGFLSC